MMEWLPDSGIVMLLAAASSLALAGAILFCRRRELPEWSFAAGMVCFAIESVAAYVLLTMTDLPEQRLAWLRVVWIAGLAVPLPWAAFVTSSIRARGTALPLLWRAGLGVTLLGSVATAGAIVWLEAFLVADVPGPFYAVRVGPAGLAAVIVEILAISGILAGLEASLRASRGDQRWQTKYVVLGLAGIFLVRFYLLSQVLLFHVAMAVYLATGAATLVLGNIVVGAALVRSRFLGAELAVSRQLLYRSIVVAVLGVYLFSIGVLGWLLNHLGIPEEIFWSSLVVFASALGVAAMLLSEDIRWRMKRFVGRHIYHSKYDYRRQWVAFTKRLGSLVTVEELAPELLSAVADAVGTTKGALYLANGQEGVHHLAAALGIDGIPPSMDQDSGVPGRLASEVGPVVLADGAGVVPCPGVAVPLSWQGKLTGFMILGPERTGRPYDAEDLEFLSTVGDQAAGAIVTVRVSERLTQSREFEAFHRLTSFVVHDLKNAVSTLSLLSRNALSHFDDPDFQRDAIKTLSRTVERMQGLLGRLASAHDVSQFHFEEVALPAIVAGTVEHIVAGQPVTVVRRLAPVPPIMGDAQALERVFQNLVTNAIEAMDGEGELTVATSMRDDGVVCAISDTGRGMAAEFIRKSLFVPFRSTKKGGWGIGLYQVREIVTAHGGTIEVESAEGGGTTFSLRFPVARAKRDG